MSTPLPKTHTTERGAHSGDLYVYDDDGRLGVVYRSGAYGQGPRFNALHEYGGSVLPHLTSHDTEDAAVAAIVSGAKAEEGPTS